MDFIQKNPAEARKYLAKNTLTPDDLVDDVPMLGYTMVKDMNEKQLGYLQEFTDFGTSIGVVPETTARRVAPTMAIAAIPLTDAWAERELTICVRSAEELAPSARQLVEHLRAAA